MRHFSIYIYIYIFNEIKVEEILIVCSTTVHDNFAAIYSDYTEANKTFKVKAVSVHTTNGHLRTDVL